MLLTHEILKLQSGIQVRLLDCGVSQTRAYVEAGEIMHSILTSNIVTQEVRDYYNSLCKEEKK